MRKRILVGTGEPPPLAETARKRKQAVSQDSEPGARRYITLCENGKDFRIPVSGPKGNWLWEEISDGLLREIIRERIKERGITTRSQLAKSKPYGARIERKAKERGILDDLLPVTTKPIRKDSKKDETKDREVRKTDPEDNERHARNKAIVTKWMADDEWWDNFLGRNKKD